MSQNDQLQRFVFEHLNIRGAIVRLDECVQHAVEHHQYPESIHSLLSQALAAITLFSTGIKVDGQLSLQLQTTSSLKLLFAEIDDGQFIRAVARYDALAAEHNFKTMTSQNGQFALTIEPKQGQRYQGVVPLDGNSLTECLQHYFLQSEQLHTQLLFFSGDNQIVGLLLQQLPVEQQTEEEFVNQWQHVTTLVETLTTEEVLNTPNEALLYRLFHSDPVRLFDASAIQYQCLCSRERCANSLLTLGKEEAEEIIQQQQVLDVTCEFCNKNYQFFADDLHEIFGAGDNTTLH